MIMKKSKSIGELEEDIALCVELISAGLPKDQWSFIVSRYHSLNIQLCHMKGERPIVTTYKSDYII